MIRSILGLQRRLSARSIVPLFIVIAGVTAPSDPTRHPTGAGYGGVLPVPTPTGGTAITSRIDPLLDPRHDARVQHGRVLYARGHEPAAAVAAKAHKAPCPERRLVQGRGQTSPNS